MTAQWTGRQDRAAARPARPAAARNALRRRARDSPDRRDLQRRLELDTADDPLARAVRPVRPPVVAPSAGVDRSSSATSRTRTSTGSPSSTPPAATSPPPPTSGCLRRPTTRSRRSRPAATVVGGALDSRGADDPTAARQSHSPTSFIRDLGAAYRASGRTTPIMDVFDQHVYADNSSLPPSMPHTASTTIAEADYTKLVALLGDAFDGTAQRGSTLPIVYGEFGVETTIPTAKAGAYSGVEPQTSGAVDEATQARYYAEAFKLALCQPNVIGIIRLPRRRRERPHRMAVRAVLRRRDTEVVAARDSRGRPRRACGDRASCPEPTAPTWSRSRRRAAPCRAAAGRRRDR